MKQKQNNKHIQSFLIKQSFLDKLGLSTRLTFEARQAYYARDYGRLEVYIEQLKDIAHPSIAQYFEALLLNNNGFKDESQAIFLELSKTAQTEIQAASKLALGIGELRKENNKAATILLIDSIKLASSNNLCAPLSYYHSQSYLSHIFSLDGKNQESIQILENLKPLIDKYSFHFPVIKWEYRNNLAYEYMIAGNLFGARNLIIDAVASPYAKVNPGWLDTHRTIEGKIKEQQAPKKVFKPKTFTLSNLLTLPMAQRRMSAEIQCGSLKLSISEFHVKDSAIQKFVSVFASPESTGIAIKFEGLPPTQSSFHFDGYLKEEDFNDAMDLIYDWKKAETAAYQSA